jgi:hypothetical protein
VLRFFIDEARKNKKRHFAEKGLPCKKRPRNAP